MLEDRPALRNTLAGAGAFSFIFMTAMLGTGFMMTGGFGFGGTPRSTPPETRGFVVVQQADAAEWSQRADAEVLAQPVAAEDESWLSDREFHEAAYEAELEGEAVQVQPVRLIRTDADIARDINRNFAADYTNTTQAETAWNDRLAAYDAAYARNAVNSAYQDAAQKAPGELY